MLVSQLRVRNVLQNPVPAKFVPLISMRQAPNLFTGLWMVWTPLGVPSYHASDYMNTGLPTDLDNRPPITFPWRLGYTLSNQLHDTPSKGKQLTPCPSTSSDETASEVCNKSRKTSKLQHINAVMYILVVICGISPTWPPESSFLYIQWRLSIRDQSETSNAWHKVSAFSTYMNPCSCGTVYTRQISHHISIGAPENHTHQAITLTFWDNISLLCYINPLAPEFFFKF